jgi:WD40 repeat protein
MAEVTAAPFAQPVIGGNDYVNATDSRLVKTGDGYVLGIFVASSSSGTIKLWDNTTGATTVLVNTFSATAATWYPLPFHFKKGLFITVGGTIDYSISYS